ncbi:MAG: peptidylprolyl isomerase [Alphaproteobacteria bacterium]
MSKLLCSPLPLKRLAAFNPLQFPPEPKKNNLQKRAFIVSPLIILLMIAILCLHAPASAQMRVAAVVNDDVISVLDLEQRIRIAAVAGGATINIETMQQLAPQVLRGLIDETLKLQASKKLGLSITDKAVFDAFIEVGRQNNMDVKGLRNLLAANGILEQSLRAQLENNLLWRAYMRRTASREIDVTDDEIDDILAQQDALRNLPKYRVQEIFLANDDQDAVNSINGIHRELVAGADFAAFARAFSQSPTAVNGGDTGLIILEQLDIEIANTIRKLTINQISAVVSAGPGHYIFKLLAIEQPAAAPESVTEISALQLKISGADAEMETNALFDRLSQPANDDVEDGGNICDQLEAAVKELHAQGKKITLARINDFNQDELREPIKSIIQGLAVNQAAPPQQINDGYFIHGLCKRSVKSADMSAEIRAQRLAIKNQLGNQKAEVLERKQLRNLRRAAYIDIRL